MYDLVLHEKETEDGYSEELSTLRETIDDLKSQPKVVKAQATESSSIVQVKSCIFELELGVVFSKMKIYLEVMFWKVRVRSVGYEIYYRTHRTCRVRV